MSLDVTVHMYFNFVFVFFINILAQNVLFVVFLFFVVATNVVESSVIENSLCGERNCIMQLCAKYPKRNFLILKVYIVTDHMDCIGSGSLCLEFMSAMGTSDLMIILSPNDGNLNACKAGKISQLYPFPSLQKLDPFPTQQSLLQFSQPMIRDTIDIIKNINFESRYYQNIMSNFGRKDRNDGLRVNIKPNDIKLLYYQLYELASVNKHLESCIYHTKTNTFDISKEIDFDKSNLIKKNLNYTNNNNGDTNNSDCDCVSSLQLDLHPLNLHVGVLFSDGTNLFGKGCIAIEYSATMTVIDSIFHNILDKNKNKNKNKNGRGKNVFPCIMMIMDQFGVLHPPQASTRSLFYENNLENICCIFHYVSKTSWNKPKYWYQNDYHHYFGLLNSLKHKSNSKKVSKSNDVKYFEKGYQFLLNNYWNELKFDIFCPTIEQLLPAPSVEDMLQHIENDCGDANSNGKSIVSKL